MEKKLTKKELFVMIANTLETMENVENKEVMLDFVSHEVSLLDKKSSSRKTTKAQEKSKVVQEHVLAILQDFAGEKLVVNEILKRDDWFRENDISSQALTSALRKLCAEKDSGVYNEMDKRKSVYFYEEKETTEKED